MTKLKRKPTDKKLIQDILLKYRCPLGYHQLRTRMLGGVVCQYPQTNPIVVLANFWGGSLPPFIKREDFEELVEVLFRGLWKEVSIFQDINTRFKAHRVPLKPTASNLGNYATVRAQEIEGFIEGLMNGSDEVCLPERAHRAATQLLNIRSIMFSIVSFTETVKNEPDDRLAVRLLIRSLGAMTEIMESEIHAAVLSCVASRAQLFKSTLAEVSASIH